MDPAWIGALSAIVSALITGVVSGIVFAWNQGKSAARIEATIAELRKDLDEHLKADAEVHGRMQTRLDEIGNKVQGAVREAVKEQDERWQGRLLEVRHELRNYDNAMSLEIDEVKDTAAAKLNLDNQRHDENVRAMRDLALRTEASMRELGQKIAELSGIIAAGRKLA